MQVYKSVKLSTWPNIRCPECKEIMFLDAWRDVKIGWSEVLEIAIRLWGIPTAFYNRDFLIGFEFGEIRLVFCGQGPRRGECEIGVPVGDEEADGKLQAFLERVRAVVEMENGGQVEPCPYGGEWGQYEELLERHRALEALLAEREVRIEELESITVGGIP